MNAYYIILSLLAVGLALAWVFRSKPYTLEDWAEIQRIEFEKHGPVSYDEPSLDEHLKIGVIVSDNIAFKRFLSSLPDGESLSDYVAVYNMPKACSYYYKDVIEGPGYYDVPFNVIKAAQNRIITNLNVKKSYHG